MITESDRLYLRHIVQREFSFVEDPRNIMWTDEEGDPIDNCDAFWADSQVNDVKYGCSKVVLFYSYLGDYVLKIPFLGEYTQEGDYRKFVNAQIGRSKGWDYCRSEEQIYKLACKEGLGDLFCGTVYLCDIDEFPVYISEKSDCALDEEKTPHQSSSDGLAYLESKRNKSGKKFYYCPAEMDDDTIGLFYDSWGKELTDKFLDFVIDNDVRDCHNGNVAFKNGKIRLIDYSGFYR